MSKNLFSLETRVKNALVKQNIEKLLGKRKQNSFEKVYSTIKVGLEKSNVAVDDKLGFTINYYYNNEFSSIYINMIWTIDGDIESYRIFIKRLLGPTDFGTAVNVAKDLERRDKVSSNDLKFFLINRRHYFSF